MNDSTRTLVQYLKAMDELGSSDLHLSPGMVPMARTQGNLAALPKSEAIGAPVLSALLQGLAPAERWNELQRLMQTRFALDLGDLGRFRFHLSLSHEGPIAAIRRLVPSAPSAEDVGFPEDLLDKLWILREGLIIVSAPPGHGASTSLAALVDTFNRLRSDLIMSFEDPIEILHLNQNSLVSQRDVRVFGGDLRVAVSVSLNEQPDVIVIDDGMAPGASALIVEMLERGVLVLVGMPFRTAAEAIRALLESGPATEDWRRRAREVVAARLRAVLAQCLLRPARSAQRRVAREILLGDENLEAAILRGGVEELVAGPRASKAESKDLSASLMELVQSGEVTAFEAYNSVVDRERFASLLRRSGIELSSITGMEKLMLEHTTNASSNAERGAAASSRAVRRRGWAD